MAWFYIATLAYLINAIVFVVDKYLLVSPIPRPFAYAFWVSVLSLAILILIPFGVQLQEFNFFIIAFVSGAALFLGNILLFKIVKLTDASVAATKVSALSAVFTYIFSLLVFKEVFLFSNFFTIAFLILGILFLGKIGRGVVKYSVLAGLFFGLSIVLLKLSFNLVGFLNGLFWTRIGFIGGALISLLFSQAREEVYFSFRQAPPKSKSTFIFNQVLSGIGFLLAYYAVLLGNVSLVNALLGIEFLFIFFLTLFLRKKIPAVAENLRRGVLAYKLLGIAFVAVGFLMILLQ